MSLTILIVLLIVAVLAAIAYATRR